MGTSAGRAQTYVVMIVVTIVVTECYDDDKGLDFRYPVRMDDAKSQRNFERRGFDFVSAATAFFDERSIRMPNASTQEEARFEQIAFAQGVGIIVVVYTIREYEEQDSYRIISARKATQTEQAVYFRGY